MTTITITLDTDYAGAFDAAALRALADVIDPPAPPTAEEDAETLAAPVLPEFFLVRDKDDGLGVASRYDSERFLWSTRGDSAAPEFLARLRTGAATWADLVRTDSLKVSSYGPLREVTE